MERITRIKSKTSVLKSSLYDYRNSHILVKWTITISEINNKQINKAKDIKVVMPMYNLIEYSDDYLKLLDVFSNIIEMNHV